MASLTITVLSLGLATAAQSGAGLSASRPEVIALRNGMRVDVVPLPGARVFALRGRIEAGPLFDPPALPGLSAVATEWLAWPLIGENARSPAIRWARPAEARSAASPLWLEFRSSGFLGQEDALLGALAGRLTSAARAAREGIAPERWERFRTAAASRARDAEGTVDGQLWTRALAALYPRGSSLASPPWGPPAGAPGDAAHLQAFLRAHVTPARTRVVLAGDFDPAGLRPRLERSLGGVPAGAASSKAAPPIALSSRESWTEVRLPRPDLGRDQILVVCPVDRSGATDPLATRALAFLLGDPASGRLERELVEPGLVLTVRTGLVEDPVPGFLFVRTAAARSQTAEVLATLRALFDDLVRGKVLEEEVEAFLARERAEQRSGDAARCAERRLLGQPGCGEPPPVLRTEDVVGCARRLFAHGAPVALVLGGGGPSER